MECQSLSYLTGIPGLLHTFGRVSKRLRDIIDDEHSVSSVDKWLVGDDHTGFRGHAASMCLRS